MTTMEMVMVGITLLSIITSWVVLYFALKRKEEVTETFRKLWTNNSGQIDRIASKFLALEDKLYDLQKTVAEAELETTKVRSKDHDRAIESIRKDLLDLQVLSGTLPSRAGTMLQEVENTLDELKSVQSKYLETRAIVDNIKVKVENLAKAYASLHFTGKEIEEMRNELEDLSRRTA